MFTFNVCIYTYHSWGNVIFHEVLLSPEHPLCAAYLFMFHALSFAVNDCFSLVIHNYTECVLGQQLIKRNFYFHITIHHSFGSTDPKHLNADNEDSE